MNARFRRSLQKTNVYILFVAGFILFFAPLDRLIAQPAISSETKVDTSLFSDMQFRSVGSTRGGRVTAAEGHPFGPNEQRDVFRSKDGGKTWENVLFASDSTGAIDLELLRC